MHEFWFFFLWFWISLAFFSTKIVNMENLQMRFNKSGITLIRRLDLVSLHSCFKVCRSWLNIELSSRCTIYIGDLIHSLYPDRALEQYRFQLRNGCLHRCPPPVWMYARQVLYSYVWSKGPSIDFRYVFGLFMFYVHTQCVYVLGLFVNRGVGVVFLCNDVCLCSWCYEWSRVFNWLTKWSMELAKSACFCNEFLWDACWIHSDHCASEILFK